jgi:hypothetical protein
MRLSEEDVRLFLFDQILHAFDPETLIRVATVQYRRDWTCLVIMENGDTDTGQYGFDGDLYWTKYNQFRDGALHRFSLTPIDAHSAQAMFEDGTRAFIQSPLAQLINPKG